VAAPDSPAEKQRIPILLASSNAGKLREYRELAIGSTFELDLLPNFQTYPAFEESAPTFAEIGAGKALHYSRFTNVWILADDSGLVVPALGGAPGVHSARYAGLHATDAENLHKLLRQMERLEGADRRARFVCVTAIAQHDRVRAVVSDFAEGLITKEIRGTAGFGYDPIFFSPVIGSTFAEASRQEKNLHSHRGKAFRRALSLFFQEDSLLLSHSLRIQR
jgi:XTP/dITP diphosphohydrolase